jgi:hypothetical protein
VSSKPPVRKPGAVPAAWTGAPPPEVRDAPMPTIPAAPPPMPGAGGFDPIRRTGPVGPPLGAPAPPHEVRDAPMPTIDPGFAMAPPPVELPQATLPVGEPVIAPPIEMGGMPGLLPDAGDGALLPPGGVAPGLIGPAFERRALLSLLRGAPARARAR